ncbi:MAG: hydroxyacid dehydrogenase [Hyphomicrobiaceae bacterium]|nr:MAG: hydroxyacid dehydrogenase [Hyphomicrobiaceae bacterium]
MAQVVVSEFMDEAGIEPLRKRFDVLYDARLVDDRKRLEGLLSGARALIVRNRTRVDGAILAAGPRLEVVGRLGVGLDNIDLAACRDRKIKVLAAEGANEVSVAEYVIAAAIMLLRNGAFHVTADVIAGKWPRERVIGQDIMGKTFGMIGFGAIARQVAKRAASFGVRLMAHDPFVAGEDPAWHDLGVTSCELGDLFATSDILSLHTPLTPQTRHLIGEKAIAAMRKGAVIINTARGGVIDERALAAALRSGHLGGAVLDVTEEEPLRNGAHLKDAPNLVVVPHVAGVTRQSNLRISVMTGQNVLAALEGRPPSVKDSAVQ